MIITMDGELHLRDVPPALRRRLQEQLTIPNPDYTAALRMGLPTWNTPRELLLYKVADNELTVPRGMAREVWRLRPKGTVFRDRRTVCPAPDWPQGSIQLRGYQAQAARAAVESRTRQGVLVMPCGAGKTETALWILRALGQPALWITHTRDLMQQAAERAAARLGLRGAQLGIISDGQRGVGTHLTVATVQSLYRMEMDGLAKRFGTVIVDECQHVVLNPATAQMFSAVLACLPAKYRYGLTATPTRADGLDGTIYMVLGDKLHEVGQAQLRQAGMTVQPAVCIVKTDFAYERSPPEADHIDIVRLRRCMAQDDARTRLLLDRLRPELEAGHTCIVLGASLELLRRLEEALRGDGGAGAVFLHGGVPAAKRRRALGDLREGKARCLLATYQLAREGLDIPRADRLFLAQPVRDATAIQQSIGRISRPADGKRDAVVYDLVDGRVPACQAQYTARRRVYKKLELTIKEEPHNGSI